MKSPQQFVPVDLSAKAVSVESSIAEMLSRTSREISFSECFDDEQRAEIYTILHALDTDTQAHRQLVGRWVNQQTGESFDA
jgi:hypothetical protein